MLDRWMDEKVLQVLLLGSLSLVLLLVILLLTSFFILENQRKKSEQLQLRIQKALEELPEKKEPLLSLMAQQHRGYQKKKFLLELKQLQPKPEVLALFQEIAEKNNFFASLFDELKQRVTLEDVYLLSWLPDKRTVYFLMEGIWNHDFDIRYSCYYALSSQPMEKEERLIYMRQLVKSDMRFERKLELLKQTEIPVEDILTELKWIDSPKENPSVRIYLLLLEGRIPSGDKKLLYYLSDFLTASKEIQIAAIHVLSKTANPLVFPAMEHLYNWEKDWEVRTVLAKDMRYFGWMAVPLLQEMKEDSHWWVRHNAAESEKRLQQEKMMVPL